MTTKQLDAETEIFTPAERLKAWAAWPPGVPEAEQNSTARQHEDSVRRALEFHSAAFGPSPDSLASPAMAGIVDRLCMPADVIEADPVHSSVVGGCTCLCHSDPAGYCEQCCDGSPEIGEAVLAERERCAKIAETWGDWCGRDGYDAEEYASRDIAAKITSGE